jgi:hypothetical protein
VDQQVAPTATAAISSSMMNRRSADGMFGKPRSPVDLMLLIITITTAIMSMSLPTATSYQYTTLALIDPLNDQCLHNYMRPT